MKIISGKFKGRVLDGFDIKGTRPTMDRVKESLFAMIQDYVKDSVILDLYAGSGNLGIEAISNGAKEAYFIDNNKIAINTILSNVNKLKIENYKVIHNNASNFLNDCLTKKVTFDIIFLDPPYQTKEIDKSLTFLNDNTSLISGNGIIVCESELNINYEKYTNFKIIKTRQYGVKNVNILQRKN